MASIHDNTGVATISGTANRSRFASLGQSELRRTSRSPHVIPEDWRGYRLRRYLLIADVSAFLLGWCALLGIDLLLGRDLPNGGEQIAFWTLVPLWLLGAGTAGLYHFSERRISYSIGDDVGPVFLMTTSWIWALVVVSSIASPDPVAILPLVTLWASVIGLILALRALVRALVRRSEWWTARAILVGTPEDLDRVAVRIRRHAEFGICVVGSVELMEEGMACKTGSGHVVTEGRPTSTRCLTDAVVRTLSKTGATQVIVTDWPNRLDERTEFLGVLIGAGIHVDLVSGEPDALASSATLQHLEGMSVLTLRPHRTNKSAAMVKRSIDVAGAGFALLMVSPLLAYIALRIKAGSPGPVLFKQRRIGKGGEPFEILKFRTMVDGADEKKAEVAHLNFHNGGDARMFKIDGDPRVTPFGAKLRKWSLDELPQLWNVVRGDMSLVGPRPLIPEEAELIEGYHAERSTVRPGITGPWQTLGRSEIPFAEMVRLDYTYVATWTIREDLRLLMRTFGVVFLARGAY